MDTIVQLPDSIANQIAAGEVVQRPASVVKELLENAIDAGATDIRLTLTDAGRTMIQVADNGRGMSDIDARMAFERHATSKIKSAADLFTLSTLGFRGEALASIAAIASVNLKTRRQDADLGTEIEISGSKVTKQEVSACAAGSVFTVKSLFYNVPARRKFLKSDQTEMRHVSDEFARVALINPHIAFSLTHNGQLVNKLSASNFKVRIVGVMGRNFAENLLPIECETTLARIRGFIGAPRLARKSAGDQFMFANGRYMRHPYFAKAILNAYERVVPPGHFPCYFVRIDVPPGEIDVNIHPTKTEIKFENERDIFQILHAAAKEALGRFNMVPSIDFDDAPVIPVTFMPDTKGLLPRQPTTRVDPTYNPFANAGFNRPAPNYPPRGAQPDWQKALQDFENKLNGATPTVNTGGIYDDIVPTSTNPDGGLLGDADNGDTVNDDRSFIQLRRRYVVTAVKSGIMVIDQHRAHFQVLYEERRAMADNARSASQRLLYPVEIEASAAELLVVDQMADELRTAGFDIAPLPGRGFTVTAIPATLPAENVADFFADLRHAADDDARSVAQSLRERLDRRLAAAGAIKYGQTMKPEEMRRLVDALFACASPAYTDDGRKIIEVIGENEILDRMR